MKIFSYLSALFALYFIFVHPALIYYNLPAPTSLEQRAPIFAFWYLGLAVIGWMTVMAYGWMLVYKYTYGLKNRMGQLVKFGKPLNAEILHVTLKNSTMTYQEKEVIVAFTNFSNTPISYPLMVSDTKPELNRYEKGKKIRLRVDANLEHVPYVVPDEAEVKLKPQRILLIYGFWTLFCLGVIAYFMYAYTTENQGYGWRFLSWSHPLIMSLIVLCMGGGIFYLINKLILSKLTGVNRKEHTALLFHGIKTTAMVSQVGQTGTYINEQPQVKFDMTFLDNKGVSHRVSIKKVVSLINLQSVHEKAKNIFYLPDSPTTIAFEEDLTYINDDNN